MVVNALSVDVEEYYHGMEFEAAVPEAQRHLLPSRVELSVERVLGLLDHAGVQATFFIVGHVASAHPSMVRRMAGAGHEIACHSDRHELVNRQSPEVFRADIQRAKACLEDICGEAVRGYRAPNYSIGPQQSWAYDCLLEAGFQYDSSIYPIVHDRYGQPQAPRFPYEIRRHGDRRLIEFPIATRRWLGLNLPIGGGGYFRLLPAALIRRGIRHVNVREQHPAMFYFHPWELDPGQPRPPMPWHHRFRHYVNLERMPAKLGYLLECTPFAPASHVLGLVPAATA
ncbi:MAG: hypothetical protein ETSY2_01070 [Candidatus Entotheonella gemina]|uniref:NodB homology domain-containing protein n=2 Tax=Candidatus Entotheonella TaxID=93171 RepID=W4MG41_9BACT|nr:MAG: hypothetical protein ETSY2_01070 [Candidatus Entotheonella gemina]